MKVGFYTRFLVFIMILTIVVCCNDDDDNEDLNEGVVVGKVTDSDTQAPISNVFISLIDASNRQPTGLVTSTNENGDYSFTVIGGDYFIALSKQGYFEIPQQGESVIPFTVVNGEEVENSVVMTPNGATDIGWISGKLTSSDVAVNGALVVATDGEIGYSTLSDPNGNYVIYNVKAGSYSVKAWKVGMNSTEMNAAVAIDTETPNVDLSVTGTTSSTVSGVVSFLATENKEVDVSLNHAITKESIPGLNTTTTNGIYSLLNVPNGEFLARASYENDGLVLDPDWIVKNGEPFVTVSGGNAIRDFSVTGAVSLISPNNEADPVEPFPTNTLPTFVWSPYSSTSDYVIEVTDSNGNLIWGGFNSDFSIKNITIPSSQTSIEYNSDGNALESLEVGEIYKWSIYASKDNVQSPTGWELISVSEDLRGLIVIEE